MAKSFHQKLKILYLMEALQKKSDENHPLTVNDLIDYLKQYGISAERKSVYNDIEELRTYGLDIVSRREKPSGFFMGSRLFELAELRLLVDAVQSSRFITAKKSRTLISKLESLTSEYEAKKLQSQVCIASTVKTTNESIYYNIDHIHEAISENRQISFQYFEWTIAREMRLKKDGERYRISPWGLIWKDENYYLIGLDEYSSRVKHYRVDKMLKIALEKEPRNGEEIFQNFDIMQFAARTFGMFGGKEETVKIVFRNQLVGVVLDRFGSDSMIYRQDEEHFTALVRVCVSSQFFGWLAGLGDGAEIVSPEEVRGEYRRFLKRALRNYINSGKDKT